MARLPAPLPLDYPHIQRIDRLQRVVGARYQGWGREERGYFVDIAEPGAEPTVAPDRFIGSTLFLALGAALRSHGAMP